MCLLVWHLASVWLSRCTVHPLGMGSARPLVHSCRLRRYSYTKRLGLSLSSWPSFDDSALLLQCQQGNVRRTRHSFRPRHIKLMENHHFHHRVIDLSESFLVCPERAEVPKAPYPRWLAVRDHPTRRADNHLCDYRNRSRHREYGRWLIPRE